MALALLAAAALLGLFLLALSHSRAQALAAFRNTWGQSASRKRDMTAIAAGHRSRRQHWNTGGALDDRTWEDLDLDVVFAELDRTSGTLGQHALYHRLRTAPTAPHRAEFDALSTLFASDASVRERAHLALSRLSDPHGYDLWWLADEAAVERRPWHALFPLLTLSAILMAVMALFSSSFAPAFFAIVGLNLAIRFATDAPVFSVASAFRQVAPIVAVAERLRFLARAEFAAITGPLQGDVQALQRLKTIARWISGDPLLLPVSPGSLTVLLNDVVSVLYEYLNLGFVLDGTGVFFGARELRARREALLRVVAAVGDIDSALSTASVRAGRNDWTRPQFRPPGSVSTMDDLRHPLVPDAIPNSVRLEPARGLLVTGSNMSGKSTLLRTVGVTVVMAQTLDTCLASTYEAAVLNVRSCIGRSDDLVSGRSYYIAEVESLLELVAASAGTDAHLFLLDELFRGTNAVERIAAGRAVLLQLLSAPSTPHSVIVASHDGELVELLTAHYEPFHFSETVADDGLVFDHRLRPGPATTRNAIALLRLHGAPPELVREAVECAAMLDAKRSATFTGDLS